MTDFVTKDDGKDYWCNNCNKWMNRSEIREIFAGDYQEQLCKTCGSEVNHQFDRETPCLDVSANIVEPTSEVSEQDLIELISKIEKLPRSQQRTILRELIDRLGRDSVANLLD